MWRPDVSTMSNVILSVPRALYMCPPYYTTLCMFVLLGCPPGWGKLNLHLDTTYQPPSLPIYLGIYLARLANP